MEDIVVRVKYLPKVMLKCYYNTLRAEIFQITELAENMTAALRMEGLTIPKNSGNFTNKIKIFVKQNAGTRVLDSLEECFEEITKNKIRALNKNFKTLFEILNYEVPYFFSETLLDKTGDEVIYINSIKDKVLNSTNNCKFLALNIFRILMLEIEEQ